MNKIYVSLSACNARYNLFETIDIYKANGITDIELGVQAKPTDLSYGEIVARLKKYKLNFIMHNYFFIPNKSFVVNLASRNKDILDLSRNYIRNSIRLCNELGINFFSIHAGFRSDPDINFLFPKNKDKITPYKTAFNIFIDSLGKVNEYALEKGVRIAIENNVSSKFNMISGRNELFLMCESEEFKELWKHLPSNNLGVLLDLGHLKVTSGLLGYDRDQFIETIKQKVFAIHIHDNDGQVDTHNKLSANSWPLEVFTKWNWCNRPLILEAMRLNISQIKSQVNLLRSKTKYKAN